jgi:hypothetical protein
MFIGFKSEAHYEALILEDYWKSRFDKTCNFLKNHIYQHLAEESLLI